ncbi:MAG TPA: NADH-quinone oxidoreductase subunit A [Oceanipulchritudo sp.]|nr:NADH-quinone oxidoreductase subunit A [Oceanipulchritudo sp.]
MELSDYLPVLIQVCLALVLGALVLIFSQLLGQKGPRNRFKDSAYECGMPPEGDRAPRFSIKFYVVAMLFILFDIEIVFLIPWVLVYRDFLSQNLPILTPVLFFILLLVAGLVYEMKKGALKWEQ